MDFLTHKELLKEGIEESEKVVRANKALRQYNWHFVNPYLRGYQIDTILENHQKGLLNPKKVSELFVKEFFDLPNTITFIDGFFKRSKFIEPYTYYIEYSLILCFQQDYAGAINLILPSIEGALANYIIIGKNQAIPGSKRFEKIRKTISIVKSDLLDMYSQVEPDGNLNRQQKDYLHSLQKKYYDNWFSVIDSFLNDSVFAHTDSLSSDVLLNRHTILHQLKITNYHTLENYIKLFNAIKFISWIFLKIEKQSLFSKISNDDFMRKWIQYEEVIKSSKRLLIHKQSILQDYGLHNDSEFNLFRDFSSIYKGMPLKQRLILKLGRAVYNMKSQIKLGKLWNINLFDK